MRCRLALLGMVLTLGAASAFAATTGGNRRDAKRDTAQLLGRVRLPLGSAASAREPAGDRGALSHAPYSLATPVLVTRHAFAVVAEPPSVTRAYVLTHPPGTHDVSGHSSTGWGFDGFALPARRGVLSQRELIVSFAPLRGGRTGVRIDALDVYVVVRPPAERVPAAARVLTVTRTPPGGAARPQPHVHRSDHRSRVVGLIDGLPLMQPGTTACPAIVDVPTVVFTFRATVMGPVLAQATLRNDADTGGPCFGGVAFTSAGRPGAVLEDDDDLLAQAGRSLGLALAAPIDR